MHNVTYHDEEIVNDTDNIQDDEPKEEDNDTRLINAMTSSNRTKLPPGDIRRVMSKGSTRFANSLEYCVSSHKNSSSSKYSLVDRGANGGVAGDDVRVVFITHRSVDIKGIDNHHVNNIDIGTVGGVVQTHKGPMIAIMH